MEYQSQAHKTDCEAKAKTIEKWKKSPMSSKEMKQMAEEHYQVHNQINPNKKKN
jgi:hypothetical protein